MEGTPFGRYRLIELLGRGGMGEVWRAQDTAIDRMVALKVLLPHYAQDRTFNQRFRREARAAARLDDPHVVPIYDVGEEEGRLYVTMRLIKGHDLQALIDDGPLEPKRAVAIIDQVATALHAAHTVQLVHRDIKPSNILITDNDFTYLIDFGIARAIGETGLTSTGFTVGTWSYMAPERFRDGQVGPSSDIYALACVLYQCLTGQLPFPATTFEQVGMAHMLTPPPKPSIQRRGSPAAMDQVIATGMAKDPDQRYTTIVEFANAAHDAITTPLAPPSEPTLPDDAPRPAPAPARRDDQVPPPPAPAPEPVRQQSAEPIQQRPPGWPPVPQPRPADRAPPDTRTPPPRRWWRRQAIVIPAALLTVAVIAAAIVITSQRHENSNGPQITLPTGSQVTLPFTGLAPTGVAVDAAGNVYVTDDNSRVVELAAGSATPTVLPFTGLRQSIGVAVDSAGNLYVADYGNNRVLKLAAGSATQSVLPFTDLYEPEGVAVDTAGNLYLTDSSNNRVLKLPAGSNTPTVLPFTGGINYGPTGVAVDTAGNLYLGDLGNNRVLKLPAGSATPTVLPFTGLNNGPQGVAVDGAGNVYVTDNNRVVKLAAGSTTQTVLPFTGLKGPTGVAVDTVGDLYVADGANGRVVKLPAG